MNINIEWTSFLKKNEWLWNLKMVRDNYYFLIIEDKDKKWFYNNKK